MLYEMDGMTKLQRFSKKEKLPSLLLSCSKRINFKFWIDDLENACAGIEGSRNGFLSFQHNSFLFHSDGCNQIHIQCIQSEQYIFL